MIWSKSESRGASHAAISSRWSVNYILNSHGVATFMTKSALVDD